MSDVGVATGNVLQAGLYYFLLENFPAWLAGNTLTWLADLRENLAGQTEQEMSLNFTNIAQLNTTQTLNVYKHRHVSFVSWYGKIAIYTLDFTYSHPRQ